MVEHGFLILAADPAEVAQEATTAGNHLGEGNFLWGTHENIQGQRSNLVVF